MTKDVQVTMLSKRLRTPLTPMEQQHLRDYVRKDLLDVLLTCAGGVGHPVDGSLRVKATAIATRLKLGSIRFDDAVQQLENTTLSTLDALLASIGHGATRTP